MIVRKRNKWSLVLALAGVVLWLLACGGKEEAAPDAVETADAAETEPERQEEGEKKQLEGPPVEGFKQFMPRGGIPALIEPSFVPAAEADMPDDAWVLAFEHGGAAYAYDLNILNHHEVVNHSIGELPVAAVW